MDVVSWKEVLGVGVGLVASVLGAMWWLAKIIVAQQQKLLAAQFEAQAAQWKAQTDSHAAKLLELERRIGSETEATRQLQQELHQLRNELPQRFVMREDFVRFSSVVEAKIDRLHEKIDDLRGEYARRSQ